MEAQDNLYKQICRILKVDFNRITEPENKKLHKASGVLHKKYLINASREARSVIDRKKVDNKYALMISIYNRKMKEHQVLVMLIQLFEVAIRTQAAIILSNKFSTANSDDWFFISPSNSKHGKLQRKVTDRANMLHESITPRTSSIDMFNMLMMGDIQGIYKDNWNDLKHLFQNTYYKSNVLTQLTTHAMFDARFNRIRDYRNDLFHGNPGRSGWRSVIDDIEVIMAQLQYNLEDTVNNIDPHHRIVTLRYQYSLNKPDY